jgi:hypothetical protein
LWTHWWICWLREGHFATFSSYNYKLPKINSATLWSIN